MYPYQEAVAQTIEVLKEGKTHADLRDPEPLNRALESMRDKIGHGYAFSVYVSADFILVDAPIAVEKAESDRWEYRRTAVTNEGPASPQPQTAREQFALADVDWSTLWPAVDAAKQLAEINETDEITFRVARSMDTEAHGEDAHQSVGPVNIRFSLEDKYHEAWFTMNADGSNLTMTSKK